MLSCSDSGACGAGLECVGGWCLASSLGPTGGGLDLSSGYVCADSPVLRVTGGLTVTTPDELEALRGCREIDALDITIDTRDILSLEALADLRAVTSGGLSIGPGVVDETFDPSLLRSLRGLDNLERLDAGLVLSHFSDADLGVLTGLARAHALSLHEFPNLTDLGALDGTEIRSGLSLSRLPELRDIAGPSMVLLDSLALQYVPLLESIAPLRGRVVGGVIELSLIETGLADVDDFASLSSASTLVVSSNPRLADLDGFGALREASEVFISSNPALESIEGVSGLERCRTLTVSGNGSLPKLPEFSSVTTIDSITISDNALLGAGPSFPALESGTLWVTGNERLETLLGFATLERADGLIQIVSNPSLREVDLQSLRQASRMQIADNPNLARLDLSALRSILDLGVYDNESLTPQGTSMQPGTAARFDIPIESEP